MNIILASKSPRRKELLTQIGLKFDCMVCEKEEKICSTNPKETVEKLSEQKAEEVWRLLSDEGNKTIRGNLVIGADTVVVYNNIIMGKPKDAQDAFSMLKQLSGKVHSVWTGVTLIYNYTGTVLKESFAVETKVHMYEISDDEIREYIESGEPDDKAGAYGIQGLGAKFIRRIEGDYNNVVGLPVSEVYQRIKKIIQD